MGPVINPFTTEKNIPYYSSSKPFVPKFVGTSSQGVKGLMRKQKKTQLSVCVCVLFIATSRNACRPEPPALPGSVFLLLTLRRADKTMLGGKKGKRVQAHHNCAHLGGKA